MQFAVIAYKAVFLVIPQREDISRCLCSRHAQGDQQAQPQGDAPVQPIQKGERQKPHHGLEQCIAVVDQRVGPGVHPQEDHGVILVPGRVKEIGVHVGANQGQKEQNVQKCQVGGCLLIEDSHAADHGQEIEELKKKDGDQFPEH